MDTLFKPKIHIRFQQVSGKRSLTLLEGLDASLDLDKICSAMRKAFACNGTVQENTIIQLQGDHRENIRRWLIDQCIYSAKELKERLVIHG